MCQRDDAIGGAAAEPSLIARRAMSLRSRRTSPRRQGPDEPEIVLREETGPGLDSPETSVPADADRDPRADSVAVHRRSDSTHEQPVLARSQIFQQARTRAEIADHDLEAAVAVEIAGGRSARGLRLARAPIPRLSEMSLKRPPPTFQ